MKNEEIHIYICIYIYNVFSIRELTVVVLLMSEVDFYDESYVTMLV